MSGKDRDRMVYKTPDGWANKRNDASRASSLHDTQAEAIAAAHRNLQNQGGGELTVKGVAYKGAMPDSDSTLDRAKVEWTVRVLSKALSSGPHVVKLIARHERAGWARAQVHLE